MTSEILIRELKNGEILYKLHGNDHTCCEFLFMENLRFYSKGWGSGFGNGEDRLIEIVKNPERWEIFGMRIDDPPPYPWSSSYDEDLLTTRLMLSDGAFRIAKEKNVVGSEYEKEYRHTYALWQKGIEEEIKLRNSQQELDHDYNVTRQEIRKKNDELCTKLKIIQDICSRGVTVAKKVGIIEL